MLRIKLVGAQTDAKRESTKFAATDMPALTRAREKQSSVFIGLNDGTLEVARRVAVLRLEDKEPQCNHFDYYYWTCLMLTLESRVRSCMSLWSFGGVLHN